MTRAEDEDTASYRARVAAWLDGIEQRLIVDGQHVFGAAPDRQRGRALVEATLEVPRHGAPGLTALMGRAGVPEAAQRDLRDALIERSVFGREDPVRVWGTVTPPPAELAQFTNEGRGILTGMARCTEELDAVVHALEGVGKNLHDHIDHVQTWRAPSNSETFGVSATGTVKVTKAIGEWKKKRTGLVTSTFAESGAFFRSSPEVQAPDLQLVFVVGIVDDHSRKMHLGHGFSCHVDVIRPHSRGTVTLNSPDVRQAPAIDMA